jgi:hypothetical protein
MVLPPMNKVEAWKYTMKVSRLVKQFTGNIPSATSQTTQSTASLFVVSQTTRSTALLTAFPDSTVSNVEVRNQSSNGYRSKQY